MLRLIAFLLACLVAAAGLGWLSDQKGSVAIDWRNYQVDITVFQAVVFLMLATALGVFLWNITRSLWKSPATVGQLIHRRRERRGLDALSEGMIAIGSGDRVLATRAAQQARKSLPNEPLTHLLRAQAAQLQGDGATSRRIFEAMLASPDTEQLGLRGLFVEAQREGEMEAARQFAERALKINPALGWPVEALFDLQCRAQDWDGALATLATGRRHNQIDRKVADRRRAVLLAGKAQAAEHDNADEALAFAMDAHKLAPDLVPAAAVAGRILAGRGKTPQAAKVIQRAWELSPHPDLATAYAYARVGDSPFDRIERVRQLAKMDPNASEGAIALATAAIDARDWKIAREALKPFLDPSRLTQRIATLMARIEGGDGDSGRVREWLARAVHAPRDPVWTADGVISETWAPVSPVTGQIDAFQWRVPVADISTSGAEIAAERTERLVALGAPSTTAAKPRAAPADVIDIETTLRTVTDDGEIETAPPGPPTPRPAETPAAKTRPIPIPVPARR
jgi:HemY protein